MPRPIGFSTGSLYPDSPEESIRLSLRLGADAVELSALRRSELEDVARAAESPLLERFRWVSIHAPSRFSEEDEEGLARELTSISGGRLPVVVHPDTIHRPKVWQDLGPMLVLENMDRRKACGQFAHEFESLFTNLPMARLCLDLAHVRQVDPSFVEGFHFIKQFSERLVELHISEVTAASEHRPLSMHSESYLLDFLKLLPESTPAIIESVVPDGAWEDELWAVRKLFDAASPVSQPTD